MGRRLVALAPEHGLTVVGGVDHDRALDDADAIATSVVIDFSVPAQAPATLAWCVTHRVPLVLGTTGLGPAQGAAVEAAAGAIPLIWAANFSLGVHVLLDLVAEAASLLDWDLEIVEAHHRKKVDAPSGTALALARRVATARGLVLDEVLRHGREGQVGARTTGRAGELGMHAVRGGSVIGEHTVSLFGDGEMLALEHRALDRDIFARGALRCAAWLASGGPEKRAPGRYGLADVLAKP